MQCAFSFFPQRLSETFLILRRSERDADINVHRSLCQIEFSRQIVEKYSNVYFHQNPSRVEPSRAELFHADGRRGRHDEANSRLSQFCEGA
jgi:hypothetical protein